MNLQLANQPRPSRDGCPLHIFHWICVGSISRKFPSSQVTLMPPSQENFPPLGHPNASAIPYPPATLKALKEANMEWILHHDYTAQCRQEVALMRQGKTPSFQERLARELSPWTEEEEQALVEANNKGLWGEWQKVKQAYPEAFRIGTRLS